MSETKDSIQLAFEKFHKENPHVYKMIVEFARTVKASGRQKYGIWAIIARLRWHYEFETTGERYKISNNHASRYARLIMETEPDLKDFFIIKQLKAERENHL